MKRSALAGLMGFDAQRDRIRFTPRKPGSTWSALNVARVAALTAEGRMRPAGLAAFARRRDDRTAIYAHEQRHAATLDEETEAQFRANPGRLGLFHCTPTLVSPSRDPLGDEREAGGDAPAPAGDSDRGLSCRADDQAADAAEQTARCD